MLHHHRDRQPLLLSAANEGSLNLAGPYVQTTGPKEFGTSVPSGALVTAIYIPQVIHLAAYFQRSWGNKGVRVVRFGMYKVPVYLEGTHISGAGEGLPELITPVPDSWWNEGPQGWDKINAHLGGYVQDLMSRNLYYEANGIAIPNDSSLSQGRYIMKNRDVYTYHKSEGGVGLYRKETVSSKYDQLTHQFVGGSLPTIEPEVSNRASTQFFYYGPRLSGTLQDVSGGFSTPKRVYQFIRKTNRVDRLVGRVA